MLSPAPVSANTIPRSSMILEPPSAEAIGIALDLLHKSKIRTSPRQSYALSPLPKPSGRGWGWGIRDFCKRS
ncbi:hypothetical protein, partial [Nostoc commune]|uniref:hypothetical protein n=1 Tax=Nostoc commune TaxID=1178 RepID=UPI001E4E5D48